MLAKGYGATSIEEIARHAGISKRTFYHRFPDKAALITAVVTRLIDGLRPPPQTALVVGDDPPQILEHLAALILQAALTPQAIQMHRLFVAESGRFPELAVAVAKAGGRHKAESLIADLLRRFRPSTATDAAFAARQFLQMIVSLPQLRALGLGTPMTAAELAEWPRRTVALFLAGWNSTG
jgi:AcrR family transcriptional regulator